MSKHIIVVGAGPGGISCAKELAQGGARVTLLDRHAKPGYKACAGGLPRSAWGLAQLDQCNLRDVQSFNQLTVISALGRVELVEKGPLLKTFHRPEWTECQLGQLRSLGVELALGVRFTGFEKPHRIVTSRGVLDFDYLVGADGATSRVKASLGLSSARLKIQALQLVVDKSKLARSPLTNTPWLWFNPGRLGSGYAWSFPGASEVRIGCGALAFEIDKKRLKQAFERLLEEQGLKKSDGQLQSGTIGCDYTGHSFGAIRLVGDAAGLASPLTGEGIAQALIAGGEVAKEILDPGYRSKVIGQLASRHRRTSDALSGSHLGAFALNLSPYLLRLRAIRARTFKKYVF